MYGFDLLFNGTIGTSFILALRKKYQHIGFAHFAMLFFSSLNCIAAFFREGNGYILALAKSEREGMKRGNKKVFKEHSLPLDPVTLGEVLPKEQTSIETK